MEENIKKGFLCTFEESINNEWEESKRKIHTGVNLIKSGVKKIIGDQNDIENLSNHETDGLSNIISFLMSKVDSIGIRPETHFNYTTILHWVKNNHIGNKFYMLRHNPINETNAYLFVFFAQDDIIYIGEDFPMVCYITKNIPEDVIDLFNNKKVYIQKFI